MFESIPHYSDPLLLIIPAAMALDFLLGDPVYRLHPIRLIGNGIIAPAESLLRRAGMDGRGGGLVLMLAALAIPAGLAAAVNIFLADYMVAFFIFNIYIVFSCVAVKNLGEHVRRVSDRLEDGDIDGAREALSMIVGRETDRLDEAAIRRACIETLAENLSDGIVAPLMYAFIGGAPLALLYKSANTMDSMVGYKNEKYARFGYFPAKLDDILNWLPARITMLMILCAGWITGHGAGRTIMVARADRLKHSSPNAGHPESAVAGALDVRLGGPGAYHGQQVYKPWLNESGREAAPADVREAWKLTLVAALLSFAVFFASRLALKALL